MVAEHPVFTREEIERLEQFRLTVGESSASFVQQLHDEHHLKGLLEQLVEESHFPSIIVAGSQFMKRYGFMTVVPILYAFTMWDKAILAGPNELCYEVDTDAEPWMMKLMIDNDVDVTIIQKDRVEIRAALANKLINENLAPFVEAMVKATKLSAAILWENVAIYLFWLYETLIPSEGNEVQVRRAKEDFHYLLKEFNCTSFTCGANPFMPYYSEKVKREEGEIRFRRTCCLYDQISEGGACCKTCPKAR
ncbi:IucA/IucC family C-terminal-domain containing protein [Pseudalkalibacillus sp. JSM 102089]|uniref:IucA/IucC family C-terminal-domain containing protein n=1 Tax=Pseudalkalibacillus sp. JSM 102089 TaxID=3229856 RepID=UPI00352448DC